MFDVPAQVLVELGLQLPQLLLGLPHVFLQLQARLPGVVVASGQSSTVTHLVTWKVATQCTTYKRWTRALKIQGIVKGKSNVLIMGIF